MSHYFRRWRRGFAAAVVTGLALLSQPSYAQKRPFGLGMTSTADSYAQAIGQTFSFVCPASDGGTAYVYGTDSYSNNSAICKAAIHAGALPSGAAGIVTILIGKPVESFQGSTRNGITTSSYRASLGSYSFVGRDAIGSATWETVWTNVPMELTTSFALRCPPGGPGTGAVWGTLIYAGGSSICAAGVHAGVIPAAQGGTIEVRRAVQSGNFVASARNGVSSQPWAAQSEAFTVSAATSAPVLRTATGAQGLAISDPVTIRQPDRTITSAPPLAAAAASPSPSGPKTVTTVPYTKVGNGATSRDLVLNVPLNLSNLHPTVVSVYVHCSVNAPHKPAVGKGATKVDIVAGRFVGTVAVLPLLGDYVGLYTPGNRFEYTCMVVAIDAADEPFASPDLAQSSIQGEFIW